MPLTCGFAGGGGGGVGAFLPQGDQGPDPSGSVGVLSPRTTGTHRARARGAAAAGGAFNGRTETGRPRILSGAGPDCWGVAGVYERTNWWARWNVTPSI